MDDIISELNQQESPTPEVPHSVAMRENHHQNTHNQFPQELDFGMKNPSELTLSKLPSRYANVQSSV